MLLKLQTKLYHRGGRNMAFCRYGATVNDHGKLTNYIAKMKFINKTGFLASASLFMLILAILVPIYNIYGAEPSEAATSYTSSTSSITFSTGRNAATISGTPTTSGKFISSGNNDSGVASFNVTTNNATGYTLSIASNKADASLTNGSTTLSALTANTTTNAGITATIFNSDTYNNMWGYMPSKVSSSSNTTKFYPMTNYTRTLDTTSGANSTANNYTIKLGARINYGQAAGTYTVASGTSFVLTAVGNAANYNITYNKNTNDIVSNLPSSTGTMSTSSSSISLSNNSVTRTGYDFLGYCTVSTSDQTSISNGSTACTNAGGTYYAKGGAFYIDETTKNVTTLYAIWYLKDITITGVFGGTDVTAINFVNATYGNKSITTNNGTTTLKYGITYTLSGSYSDGNEFESWSVTGGSIGSTSSASTTYSATSAVTITLNGKHIAPGQCTDIASCMQTFSFYSCTASGTTLTDARDGNTYRVIKIGDLCWMRDNLKIMGTITAELSNFSGSDFNIEKGGSLTSGDTYTDPRATLSISSSYPGAYYNYCAASAGTICTDSNSAEASSDICPSGWRLPTNSEFGTIGASSGSTTDVTAFAPTYSGYYYNGRFRYAGSSGGWWSSTAYDAANRFRLHYNGGILYPGSSGNRQYGFSVRCVKEKPKLYFQNATSADCGETMYDNRGTDTYKSIAYSTKMVNGLCWMTRNLDLPGGTALSQSDSNLNDSITSYALRESSTSGFNDYTTGWVYNSGRTACTPSSACYSYYSYITATAGENPSSGHATSDICPYGWRLPTQEEYTSLIKSYGTGTSLLANWSGVYSGYYGSGTLYQGGANGWYWSSTAASSNGAFFMGYYDSSSYVRSNRDGKNTGFAIRCVAKS